MMLREGRQTSFFIPDLKGKAIQFSPLIAMLGLYFLGLCHLAQVFPTHFLIFFFFFFLPSVNVG